MSFIASHDSASDAVNLFAKAMNPSQSRAQSGEAGGQSPFMAMFDRHRETNIVSRDPNRTLSNKLEDRREAAGRAEPQRQQEPAKAKESPQPLADRVNQKSDEPKASAKSDSVRETTDTKATESKPAKGEADEVKGDPADAEVAEQEAPADPAEVLATITQAVASLASEAKAAGEHAAATTTAAKQQAPQAEAQAFGNFQPQTVQPVSTQPTEASPTPGIAIVDQPASQAGLGSGAHTGGDADAQAKDQGKPAAAQVSMSAAESAGARATSHAASPPGMAPDAVSNPSGNTSSARIAPPTANLQMAGDASKPANDDANVARVSRGLSSAIAQRGGAVTLRLTPVEMGTVRIQMQMTGTTLTASFHAESASAQTLLTQQLGSLRQSLESQGLQVERLTVQSMQAAPSQNAQSGSNSGQQQDANGQQQSNHDGRSRNQYSQSGSNSQDNSKDSPSDTKQRPLAFQDHIDQQHAADAA